MVLAVIHRAYRFRLCPTPEQEDMFRQFAGVTRLVYNLALEQRRTWWRRYQELTGDRLNFVSQGREVTALRAAYPWIAAVPVDCATQALRDLDRAYSGFFEGRSEYPTPRQKGRNDSFRFKAIDIGDRQINRRWRMVRIPKIGWVKYRVTRAMAGELQNVTISRDNSGWHVSFACKIAHEAPANDNPSIGIDRGVVVALSLSNGETLDTPNTARISARMKRAQRRLARCQIGSRRRGKKLARLRKLSHRAALIRRDWQHRASTSVACRYGVVAIEALKITNMTASGGSRKRGLNRSIMEKGWGAFARMLEYKLEERGGTLIKVNPAYTSQTCSDCGTVDRRSRESQASFVCTECGFRANADHNAAINILRRSTSAMPVEGCGYAPSEPGTSRAAA